jgi:ElaB/YqjD/DUF883 family membrane-anchored ribosome-binding protein
MNTETQISESEADALAEMQTRFRKSIERAEAEARSSLNVLSKYVAERPLRSLCVAFLVGFGTARLLQRLK